MVNEKKYNIFIFLSSFARSLIEVFIPIVLYNKGLNLYQILIFLLCYYLLAFMFNFPIMYMAKKMTFKWLLIGSSFLIGIAYYCLFVLPLSPLSLFFFTLTYVINSHIYWLARNNYALKVLTKRNIGADVGSIIIWGQIALIPASYIGALMINHLNIELVLIVTIFLYMMSVIPIFKLNESKKETNYLDVVKEMIKITSSIPKRSRWFYLFAQFRAVGTYLFPLYIFLTIQKNYEYIGFFNIAVGLASMCFVYIFSRKMDKEKKDYLILSGVFSCSVWLLKLNIVSASAMLIIGILEGITGRMYDTSFQRDMLALGKHYNNMAYVGSVEGIQNFARVIIVFILVFFINDLKLSLYLCSFMLIITGLIGFDDGEGGY